MASKKSQKTATKTRKRRQPEPVALVGEIQDLIKDLQLEDESLPEDARGAAASQDFLAPIGGTGKIGGPGGIPSTIMCPW